MKIQQFNIILSTCNNLNKNTFNNYLGERKQ